MTTNLANKTSIKVPFQLPEFIRSESGYQTFVAFIQAYYEWMEQNNTGNNKLGAVYGSQNLMNYSDVDFIESGETYNKFIDYFANEFLPNFPAEALADKSTLIKVAKNIYGKKGTPAAYNFLFRALYDSDADIFLTRDVILKASDGKWYIPQSLRLLTSDPQFLNINNLRLFGDTSKSIATVERAMFSSGKTEVFISNIERLFSSGEDVTVVDNKNQPVYFLNGNIVPSTTPGATTLSAKILGSISSLDITPTKRGQLYVGRSASYDGDPVVFYGGLNSPTGIGAKAFVNEATSGSIKSIATLTGGQGYRTDPNTIIQFSGGGGVGATANVTATDPSGIINVALIPQDYMSTAVRNTKINANAYPFFTANTAANSTCSLANAFTFTSFSAFPISFVTVASGGGGFLSLPTVKASSVYDTLDPTVGEGKLKGDLAALGILSKIDIITPGTGYSNGQFISFTGTSEGVGANANVTVNATGSIISVNFRTNSVNGKQTYPKGGLGYNPTKLPTVTVIGAGSGAVLAANNILGTGATFTATPDERGIGAITTFFIENFGEDYSSGPSVSLKVRDIIVQNVSATDLVNAGENIYQGNTFLTASTTAFVDSITLLQTGDVPANSKYRLRTYNYTSSIDTTKQIKVTDRSAGANIFMNIDTTFNTFDANSNPAFVSGVKTYGNGAATAVAKFLNGLIIGQGQYLKDDGFPSSFQVLENEDYNNFTYRLVVEQAFDSYKDVLFKLLHPAGTKVIPVNALKSQQMVDVVPVTSGANSHTLQFKTGNTSSFASMFASFTNVSNNIVKFGSLGTANIATFLTTDTYITISSANGPNVKTRIVSVNTASNTVVLWENVFLRYANVATCNVVNSNGIININTLTGNYDIINNGVYTNANNKLADIVFVGDKIRAFQNVSNDYQGTVSAVDYANNKVTVTPSPSFTANGILLSVGRDITTTDVQIHNVA